MSTQIQSPHQSQVHETLSQYILTDGFPLVFDMEASQGSWIVDARDGEKYLDLFSFFASLPLGFNHPVFNSNTFKGQILKAATHKPSNSDAYTEEYARFVEIFGTQAAGPDFPHLFFVEGGALAVENAMKTAFDWKVRKNLAAGRSPLGTQILHFKEAFHGRSGYTLSVTNTDPVKTDFFPKFDWPRIENPKIQFPLEPGEVSRVEEQERLALVAMEECFKRNNHDIAGILIEPIQGEGGDNHFRPQFFATLRTLADRHDALLIFDEVQTGFGLTGKFWAYEHYGVRPDIVCFGKKAQVCGIMVGQRVEEVQDHVFEMSSRINSTWGGSLVDMVRCEWILKTIEEESLVDRALSLGKILQDGLRAISSAHPELISNVRGKGLFCAFDMESSELRSTFLKEATKEHLLILPCGEISVRFRPALTIKEADIAFALEAIERVVDKLA